MSDIFWNTLTPRVRGALKKAKIEKPWKESIKHLLRIPGVGPGSIKEIAIACQRHQDHIKIEEAWSEMEKAERKDE